MKVFSQYSKEELQIALNIIEEYKEACEILNTMPTFSGTINTIKKAAQSKNEIEGKLTEI
jgi:hypothetical protein